MRIKITGYIEDGEDLRIVSKNAVPYNARVPPCIEQYVVTKSDGYNRSDKWRTVKAVAESHIKNNERISKMSDIEYDEYVKSDEYKEHLKITNKL